MPKSAADLASDEFLSLLVLAPPGAGKTRLAGTAPDPIYFMCSDDESKLDSALNTNRSFSYDLVNAVDKALYQQFDTALAEARRGVEAGRYKTVVWDTLSMFAFNCCSYELESSGGAGRDENSRTAYDVYNRRLRNCIGRFLNLRCHRVAMSHDYTEGDSAPTHPGQTAKTGQGIIPNVPGSIRKIIPGFFHDVVYLKLKTGSIERELLTSLKGVYGPKMNGLPGVESVPADLSALVARLAAAKAKPSQPSKVTAPAKGVSQQQKVK